MLQLFGSAESGRRRVSCKGYERRGEGAHDDRMLDNIAAAPYKAAVREIIA